MTKIRTGTLFLSRLYMFLCNKISIRAPIIHRRFYVNHYLFGISYMLRSFPINCRISISISEIGANYLIFCFINFIYIYNLRYYFIYLYKFIEYMSVLHKMSYKHIFSTELVTYGSISSYITYYQYQNIVNILLDFYSIHSYTMSSHIYLSMYYLCISIV